MTAAPIKHGLMSRLRAAGSLVMRGKLPFTEETIARYFSGGILGGGELTTKSYSRVAVVYACVRKLSSSLAGLPLVVSAADDEVIESGPLVQLVERPNPGQTARAFWMATSAWLDLFGVVHWVFELDAGGRPVQIYPVSPLQMKPRRDERTGELLAWKYRPAGSRAGEEQTLTLDRVHTIIDPDFSDTDPLAPLSPRHSVEMAIRQLWNADIANNALLRNGMNPAGAFRTDANLSDEQRRVLSEDLKEMYAGVGNRGRALLLEGGLEWQSIMANLGDMEFSTLKKMNRVDVCMAYNVPPPLVGVFQDSNYAHAAAAAEEFWTNTMMPRAARLAEEFTLAVLDRYSGDRSLALADARKRRLDWRERVSLNCRHAKRAARKAGRSFYAWFDLSQVPEIQRAQLALTDQLTKWWSMGVPLNQLLRASDAPFEEVPYGDVGYKPIGLYAYGEDVLDSIDHPPGSADETDLLEEPAEGGDKTHRQASGAELRATEATRARLWVLWAKSWQPLERKAHEQLKRHFFGLRGHVLAALDRVKDQLPPEAGSPQRAFTATERRDLIGSVLFDLEQANGGLLAKLGPLIRESYRLGGEQSMQEAADAKGTPDAPDPFNIKQPRVAEKMRAHEVKLTGVNTTLRRKVARTIAEGIDNGDGYEAIKSALKEQFNFARNRAAVIARTEIGAAVESARHEGRQQAGVPMKSWLGSRKETSRPQHMATEHETVANPIPNDQAFTISGTSVTCQHPRSTGDPAHDINCGCTTIARYPGDTIKSLLSRYAQRGFLTYGELVARDTNPRRKDATDGTHQAHD